MGLEILHITTYIITNKFCKKNFPLKCIPGLALVWVLPLGQGGRPPDVWVGLEIFLDRNNFRNIFIISNKFCKKNLALKCISGLGPIWVTPEVLHEDYLQAYVPGAGGVGAGPSQGPDSKNRGPYESIHTL